MTKHSPVDRKLSDFITTHIFPNGHTFTAVDAVGWIYSCWRELPLTSNMAFLLTSSLKATCNFLVLYVIMFCVCLYVGVMAAAFPDPRMG